MNIRLTKSIAALTLALLLLAGCTSTTSSSSSSAQSSSSKPAPVTKVSLKIAALKGATAMGMVSLMENAAAGKAINDYNFSILGTPDEIVAKVVKGEVDIAAVPCNLASVLYAKTEGAVSLAAIDALGVLYVIESGDTIKTVADLKGKTIYSTGKGATPEYTLNYLLKQSGLDPEKDVDIQYKSESTEVAALLNQGQATIAVLPQPYVATVMMKNSKLRIALDISKEWNAVDKTSSVVTGVVIVRNKVLTENKAAVEAFLSECKTSVDYVNANTEAAAALVEKYDIAPAAVAKIALPLCNIVFIQGEEMKNKVSGYLKVLFSQNPASVGGKLPDDAFYYKK